MSRRASLPQTSPSFALGRVPTRKHPTSRPGSFERLRQRLDKTELSMLLRAVHHRDKRVRASAMESLGRVAPSQARKVLPLLCRALQDKTIAVAASAASALGRLRLEAAPRVACLRRVLQSQQHWMVRVEAANSLRAIGPPAALAALPALEANLSQGTLFLKCAAARALGRLGPAAQSAIPALGRALQKEVNFVKICVIQALGRLGPETRRLRSALVGALSNKDIEVRKATIRTLAGLGGAACPAVLAISRRLRDRDILVRVVAARALERLGPLAKAAVPALCRALGQQDSNVRLYSARALGRIGRPAAIALPLLHLLQKKAPESTVRVAARRAIEQISAAPTATSRPLRPTCRSERACKGDPPASALTMNGRAFGEFARFLLRGPPRSRPGPATSPTRRTTATPVATSRPSPAASSQPVSRPSVASSRPSSLPHNSTKEKH